MIEKLVSGFQLSINFFTGWGGAISSISPVITCFRLAYKVFIQQKRSQSRGYGLFDPQGTGS